MTKWESDLGSAPGGRERLSGDSQALAGLRSREAGTKRFAQPGSSADHPRRIYHDPPIISIFMGPKRIVGDRRTQKAELGTFRM